MHVVVDTSFEIYSAIKHFVHEFVIVINFDKTEIEINEILFFSRIMHSSIVDVDYNCKVSNTSAKIL